MRHAEVLFVAATAAALFATAGPAKAADVPPEVIHTIHATDYIEGNIPKKDDRLELETATPAPAPAQCYWATWRLTVRDGGRYSIWLVGGRSGHFGRSPYDWSLDGGPFQLAGSNALVTAATNLQAYDESTIELARNIELKAGQHKLTFRILKQAQQKFVFRLKEIYICPVWEKLVTTTGRILLATGDRVCFVGDSITTAGFYVTDVIGTFQKAFPKPEVRFFLCDNPGDTTETALERLDRDVIARKPTWVVIALGINDVRDFSLYRYVRNLEELVARTKMANARVMLLTPTLYDEDPAKLPRDATGYIANMLNNTAVAYHNRVLPLMKDEIARIAAERTAVLADVYTPIKNLLEQRKAGGHSLDLLPDRVHPSREGHTAMALVVLQAFGLSAGDFGRSGMAVPDPIAKEFMLGP